MAPRVKKHPISADGFVSRRVPCPRPRCVAANYFFFGSGGSGITFTLNFKS